MHPKSHLLPLMISTDKEMKKKFIWGKAFGEEDGCWGKYF
jgi:hypothetical protein